MITIFPKTLLLFSLLVCIGNISCKKSNKQDAYYNIESFMDIIVLDENNNDLLDPSKDFPKSVKLSDISVTRIIDGEEEIINMSTKGYLLLSPEGIFENYSLRLFLGIPKRENPVSNTIIRWNTNDENKLTAYFIISDHSIVNTKLLLDGEEVWSTRETNNPEGGRYIILHK